MKIANILRRIAFDEWGGTETAVWNASKELCSMGNNVEVLSTTALCSTESEVIDGIVVKRFPYFYPQLFLKSENALALDKKGGNPFSLGLYSYLAASDFDILHTHAMGRIAKEVRKAARKIGVPYVISFHGGNYDVPQSEFDEMAKPLKGSIGYGRFVEKLFRLDCDIVEQADGVICVGQNELEELKKRFPDKRAVCIPNGVDADKFQKNISADFRAAHNIPKDKKLILCVSRIDYQKNQLALVRLVKDLAARGERVHCAIVGFVTSRPYYEMLKAAVKTEGLEADFTFVEGLPPDSEMLVSAYRSADLFALPSVHEPFGIVALEAWSAGVPLIAARVGGLKTLVEDGKTGYLFDPQSPEEMLAAYRSAMQNASAISALGASQAREKYSWNAVAKQLFDFYKTVLHGK